MIVEVTDERRKELTSIIKHILETDWLNPGDAGKLKGKLQFAVSQLWGKSGRAFLRALSERQYWRMPRVQRFELNTALKAARFGWLILLCVGKPRCIAPDENEHVDAVLYTDGYHPEGGADERSLPGVGAVLFSKGEANAIFTRCDVTNDMTARWLPRSTQICMVELMAVAMALRTFSNELRGKKVVAFVDAQAVEGALVKGYSCTEDVCEAVGLVWNLACELEVLLYFDRVSTDANISDEISRGTFRIATRCGWLFRESVWATWGPG